MNYIIMDLEFNQASNIDGNKINTKLPFEIIQIGIIKLDNQFNTIATMNSLIKPEVYTSINPYVEELTGISSDKISLSKSFKEVFHDLVKYFDEESILCVWGLSDIRELYRNVIYHNLDVSLIPKLYINMQRYVSKSLNLKKGINIGLNSATEIFNITINDRFHDAFNDALYTAEVFKKTYSGDVLPQIYIYNKPNTRISSVKSKLDTSALFNQFEKMFSKELADEEKSMIELAYKMGKTNQFQISTSNKKE